MQCIGRSRVRQVVAALAVTSCLVLGGGGAAHAVGASSNPPEYPYDPTHEVEGNDQALVFHLHQHGTTITVAGQLRDVTGQGRELAPEEGATIFLDFAAPPNGPAEFLTTRINHDGFYKFPPVHLSVASDLLLHSQSDQYTEELSKNFTFKKIQKAPVRMHAGFSETSSRTGTTVNIYGSPEYEGAWTSKHAAWTSIYQHATFALQRKVGSRWATLSVIKAGFNDADTNWQTIHYQGVVSGSTTFRWTSAGSSTYRPYTSNPFTL